MSTGAKVAIGCAIVAVVMGIVAIVAVGGAAWWLKGKAEQVVGDIGAKAEEIQAYEKKANANPFTEPADGVVPEARLVKFLEVRKAIHAVYEAHRAEFESMKDKRQADFSDLTKFAGLVAEIKLAQAKALAGVGMSDGEYLFLQGAIYKSAWAAATVKETGKQPAEVLADAVKQAGGAVREEEAASELAQSAESLHVPTANIDLFHKHQAEIQKYAMSGLALLGL